MAKPQRGSRTKRFAIRLVTSATLPEAWSLARLTAHCIPSTGQDQRQHAGEHEHPAIDAYARRIGRWQPSRTAHAASVLNALGQALHECRLLRGSSLVHQSDRGSQYLARRGTERLAKAGVEPTVGSIGDSYDHVLGGRRSTLCPSPR